MTYHYRIWCPDCLGEDPQGCFGGGVENDDEEFSTPQEANKAGWNATLHNIYQFEVVDEQGNTVEVKETPW